MVNQTRPLLMLFLLHFVIFGNIEYIFYSRRRRIFFVLLFLCNVYFTSKAAMASNNCSSHLQTCCIAQFIAKKLWQIFYNDGVGILSSSTHMTDLWDPCLYLKTLNISYTGWPQKNGTVDTVDFSGLCSDQQLSFFTLLDRASFPHYNNTKIIKFGRELLFYE